MPNKCSDLALFSRFISFPIYFAGQPQGEALLVAISAVAFPHIREVLDNNYHQLADEINSIKIESE
jgi:hypothetical protein